MVGVRFGIETMLPAHNYKMNFQDFVHRKNKLPVVGKAQIHLTSQNGFFKRRKLLGVECSDIVASSGFDLFQRTTGSLFCQCAFFFTTRRHLRTLLLMSFSLRVAVTFCLVKDVYGT